MSRNTTGRTEVREPEIIEFKWFWAHHFCVAWQFLVSRYRHRTKTRVPENIFSCEKNWWDSSNVRIFMKKSRNSAKSSDSVSKWIFGEFLDFFMKIRTFEDSHQSFSQGKIFSGTLVFVRCRYLETKNCHATQKWWARNHFKSIISGSLTGGSQI